MTEKKQLGESMHLTERLANNGRKKLHQGIEVAAFISNELTEPGVSVAKFEELAPEAGVSVGVSAGVAVGVKVGVSVGV